MVINPGTPTGSCLVGVSADGTTWKYLEKTAPVGGFKRGVKYVVTVDAADATLENVVVGGSGKVWMDRNLGATKVAASSTDTDAYGYIYQWGRGTDGHQRRESSGTTTTLSNLDDPDHNDFILTSSSPYDWRNPQNHNLWQGASGTNNPCPSGFRLPTYTEIYNEKITWVSNNAAGAFASPLKLTVAGYKLYGDATNVVVGAGSSGYYWTSTVDGTEIWRMEIMGSNMVYPNGRVAFSKYARSYGYSVRCIKD